MTPPLEVTVLFPSSPPAGEEVLAQARAEAERLGPGLRVRWPREIRARRAADPTDYLAGPEEARRDELLEFYLSPTERVGWFGRGGYGVTRLLSSLQAAWPEGGSGREKRWMGYSDITALFAFARVRRLDIQSIHGPMLCALARQPNREDLLGALAGLPVPVPFEPSDSTSPFTAPIWGGNLAVLASLCGTPWLPAVEEETAIFLEDVDEAPYRVDRYLTQLHDSGFFSRSRRVLLGTFTGFEPAAAVLETASRRCRELGLEVLGRVPVGHSEPHTPLFLDRPYRFEEASRKLVPLF